MPVYTYACDKCKEKFTSYVSKYENRDNPEKCRMPECDGDLARDEVYSMNFTVKGKFTAKNNYGLKGK